MAASYVIWAEERDGRLKVYASNARYRIPFGVQVITTVDAVDLKDMLHWCGDRARRGWSVERMRRASGEEA